VIRSLRIFNKVSSICIDGILLFLSVSSWSVHCTLRTNKRLCDAILSGIPHRVMQDDTYKGMFIPKGSIVLANALCLPTTSSIPPDAD
jgi:hypothetical protein